MKITMKISLIVKDKMVSRDLREANISKSSEMHFADDFIVSSAAMLTTLVSLHQLLAGSP